MKTTLAFHTETLRAPWFRSLPLGVRVFWTYLLGESDSAGWWMPDWDVAQAWLKLPESDRLDPEQVERLLVQAGQIKVHPSGWWELTEYLEQQFPRGLSDSQAFHRSVKRQLEQHQKRERAVAPKVAVAGPAPEAGVGAGSGQEEGGGSASDAEGHGSPMHRPSMADACKTQAPGPDPGPRAQDPGQGPSPSAPTGGPGGEPMAYEGQARELALSVLVNMLRAGGVEHVTEAAVNALGALLDAQGQAGAAETLKTWHKATRRHSEHSLLLWLQDRRDACDHPDTPERRRWWTARLADGQRQKHWRCLVCGHHEAYGPVFSASVEAVGVAA